MVSDGSNLKERRALLHLVKPTLLQGFAHYWSGSPGGSALGDELPLHWGGIVVSDLAFIPCTDIGSYAVPLGAAWVSYPALRTSTILVVIVVLVVVKDISE